MMGGFRVSWVPEMFGRFQKLADELYSEQCVQLSLGALWGIHDVKKKKGFCGQFMTLARVHSQF